MPGTARASVASRRATSHTSNVRVSRLWLKLEPGPHTRTHTLSNVHGLGYKFID